MVDMRHIEQKSIRPVSKEPASEGRYQDPDCIDDRDGPIAVNTASNEQYHAAMQTKYQSIRNKRTNSLH